MLDADKNCSLAKILKLIEKLQKNTCCDDVIDNSCSRPFLGVPINIECYNTRPVTFYKCDNSLFSVNYTAVVSGETLTGTTSTFRVLRVDDCCVLVSLLIPNPDTTLAATRPYIDINQTVTINLKCVCALKCLSDVIVDL